MKLNLKHILLVGIMMMLFIPLLQHTFQFKKEWPLGGDYVPAENIKLTSKNWFDKSFQEQKEKYHTDHFGFHHKLVRLNNQISYSIFNKAKANGVVIGINHYLYEQNYIDAYYGNDFVGEDSIRIKMEKLKFVIDSLENTGTRLMVVFAPGKAAFFPEYIPEKLRSTPKTTNLEVYRKYANELNIPHVDFHSWFIKQKDKSAYPLYPQHGTHWSLYGATIAMDSMLLFMEQLGNVDMPDITVDSVRMGTPEGADYDIEYGMNLLTKLKTYPMAYPVPTWEPKDDKDLPSVMTVADSYYWQPVNQSISYAFGTSEFWYYCKEIYSLNDDTEDRKVDDVDLVTEVHKHDFVIIMCTDASLNNFGFGFIERLYEAYQNESLKYMMMRIKHGWHRDRSK